MTAFWGIVAAIGVLAFVTTSDWPRAWSIYLVNLVFWGALAITGPAVAGMMQLTEARWSPTVRRLAITTIGFLPIAFVLLVLLFAGRATLYPWVTTPVPVKAAWLNVPFFFGRTLVLAAVLFLYGFARARTGCVIRARTGSSASRAAPTRGRCLTATCGSKRCARAGRAAST